MNAPVAASEDLIYSVEDGIGRVTFNRPQARNALTFAMYERLARSANASTAINRSRRCCCRARATRRLPSGTDI